MYIKSSSCGKCGDCLFNQVPDLLPLSYAGGEPWERDLHAKVFVSLDCFWRLFSVASAVSL